MNPINYIYILLFHINIYLIANLRGKQYHVSCSIKLLEKCSREETTERTDSHVPGAPLVVAVSLDGLLVVVVVVAGQGRPAGGWRAAPRQTGGGHR